MIRLRYLSYISLACSRTLSINNNDIFYNRTNRPDLGSRFPAALPVANKPIRSHQRSTGDADQECLLFRDFSGHVHIPEAGVSQFCAGASLGHPQARSQQGLVHA